MISTIHLNSDISSNIANQCKSFKSRETKERSILHVNTGKFVEIFCHRIRKIFYLKYCHLHNKFPFIFLSLGQLIYLSSQTCTIFSSHLIHQSLFQCNLDKVTHLDTCWPLHVVYYPQSPSPVCSMSSRKIYETGRSADISVVPADRRESLNWRSSGQEMDSPPS